MKNFEFWAPTKFYFGKGVDDHTGEYLKNFGVKKTLLVHYGTGMDFETKLVEKVIRSLEKAEIQWVDFQGIKPNPIYETCEDGTSIAKKEQVDFILAIGGGSVLDTAKYISIAYYHEGDTWDDFYAKPNPVQKALPVGSITTIAGTGSEASSSSVVTKGILKRSCNDDQIRPKIAILNPELTYTLPPFQTACGAVDIMAHVHERYFTYEGDHYLMDNLAEAIFRTVIKYLPVALKDPTNYEARAQLLWASIIGHNESVGLGRGNDRYGLAHAIQSEIGGRYDSAHGAGCALATLGMMKYLYKRDIPRFERYFNQVWGIPLDPMDTENMILRGIAVQEQFYKDCNIPTHYADLGVKEEDIPSLAASVRKGPDGFIGGSMRLTEEDIIEIYKLMK